MDRKCWLLVAALMLIGCRTQAPIENPFLPQTTVPPPGAAGAGVAPLYSGTPQVQIAPGGAAPPATLGAPMTAPGTLGPPATTAPPPPGAVPGAPGMLGAPAAPTTNTPYYPPGGMFDFKSSSTRQRNSDVASLAPPQAIEAEDDPRALVQPGTTAAGDRLDRIAAYPAADEQVDGTASSASAPIDANAPDGSQLSSVASSGRPAESTWSPNQAGDVVRSQAGEPAGEESETQAIASSVAAAPARRAEVVQASYARPTANMPAKPTTARLTGYGHDDSYGTLAGKLERSQIKGQWKLRYIPIDGETDRYGGSVVIGNPAQLSGLRPGEFVTVEGAVTDERAPGSRFAPMYQIRQVSRQNL